MDWQQLCHATVSGPNFTLHYRSPVHAVFGRSAQLEIHDVYIKCKSKKDGSSKDSSFFVCCLFSFSSSFFFSFLSSFLFSSFLLFSFLSFFLSFSLLAIPQISTKYRTTQNSAKSRLAVLKVHKIENFFDSDFGICIISLLVMSKY